jgi:hypothetical protein
VKDKKKRSINRIWKFIIKFSVLIVILDRIIYYGLFLTVNSYGLSYFNYIMGFFNGLIIVLDVIFASAIFLIILFSLDLLRINKKAHSY